MRVFIRRIIELADSVVAGSGLNSPLVSLVEVLEKDPEPSLNLVKVTDGSYILPTAGSIYVVKATPDLLVLRVTAAYYALAILATFGTLDIERAVNMSRETYFRLLVRLTSEGG